MDQLRFPVPCCRLRLGVERAPLEHSMERDAMSSTYEATVTKHYEQVAEQHGLRQ